MTSFDKPDNFDKPKQYDDDWKTAVAEVDPPQPAPGKKVISFSLPQDKKADKPVRKPRKQVQSLGEDEPIDFTVYNQEDYRDLASSPRRRAREVAMMLLFAACGGCDWQTAANILDDAGVKDDNIPFALELARTAFIEAEESDALLKTYSKGWTLDRFSAVDHAILRLAVCELRHDKEDQHSIIINEAIELGKKFSSDDSSAFINGMLDTIYSREFKPVESAQ